MRDHFTPVKVYRAIDHSIRKWRKYVCEMQLDWYNPDAFECVGKIMVAHYEARDELGRAIDELRRLKCLKELGEYEKSTLHVRP